MANDNKLQSAVEFLLDEHLKGEPSDEETKIKFQKAKAHRDGLATEDKAEKAAAEVEAASQVPQAAPAVLTIPTTPPVPKAA
jgi:hypothetical protein